MTRLARDPALLVWGVLVVATVVSWQVGTHGSTPELSTAIVLAVAFVKVRLVGGWFMELRHAPRTLQIVFDAYVAVVGAAVIVLYLVL